MDLIPLQTAPPFVASVMSYAATGGFEPGSGAYLRVGVVGFIREGKTDIAIVTPIERDGTPCSCPGARTEYYLPVKHLVPGKMVALELAEEAICHNSKMDHGAAPSAGASNS